jgi:hypothetical protein
LTNPASPVLKLRGATGTGQAPVEHWWTDAAQLDGSEWDGARIARGSVFLPLRVSGHDSMDFIDKHTAFKRSLDPSQLGSLRVSRPDGTSRTIACRYESGADSAIELDPVMMCRAVYGVTWANAEPFWSGEPVVKEFAYAAASSFFPGPPFTLASASTLASATVVNPGDVEAYPVWRVTGPFTGFEVGVGASVVAITLTRTAGQWVEIDMNPRRLTIVDNAGTRRWDAATEAVFEPIPPGEVALTTQVDDPDVGTKVTLSFTPRYREAW